MKVLKSILFFPFELIRKIWRLLTIPFWAKGALRERYFLVLVILLGYFAVSVIYPVVWNKPAEALKPRIEYSGTKVYEWTNWRGALRVAEALSPEPHSGEFLGRPVGEFSLGLDLVGGAHLEYKADTSTVPPEDVNEKMSALRDAVERRVNLFGVSEPVVQVASSGDEERLIVELAGVHEVAEAVEVVGRTAQLEFRLENPDVDPDAPLDIPELQNPPEGGLTEEQQERILEQIQQQRENAWIPTDLNGSLLQRASVVFQDSGAGGMGAGALSAPQIQLEFTQEGADLFQQLTADHVGERMAIFLDDSLLTAPTIQDEISGGTAVITGDFTIEEARREVQLLNAGALPLDVELIAQRTVGATLGAQSLDAMQKAGLWALVLILVFMVLIYRLPGVAALLTLSLYTGLMLALYQLVPVTLTLAGIAGFILSIGMAVDANILIFARMKEEKDRGRTPVAVVEEGFSRAWTAIRDANLSTLITTVILYTVGTSFVQGFALALGIGVLVSLFTAYVVGRLVLREVVRHEWLTKPIIF